MEDASILLKTAEALGSIPPPFDQRWNLAESGGDFLLSPMPKRLYRGQIEHHWPLSPSLLRGTGLHNFESKPSPDDLASMAIRRANDCWFQLELRDHPVLADFIARGWSVSGQALAQHYGLATQMLDATHSYEVACFFATNRQVAGGWEPVASGDGVVHEIDLLRVAKSNFEKSGKFGLGIRSIGMLAFPRPVEQFAWTVQMAVGRDAASHDAVRGVQFKHDRSVGIKFNDMFDGGEKLFPPDPAAEVANIIRNSHEVIEEWLDRAIADLYGSYPGKLDYKPGGVRAIAARRVGVSARVGIMKNQNFAKFDRMWWPQVDDDGTYFLLPVKAEITSSDDGARPQYDLFAQIDPNSALAAKLIPRWKARAQLGLETLDFPPLNGFQGRE
jgi:hypothetical protein